MDGPANATLSIDNWLAVVAPGIPRALISERALSHIRQLARVFPAQGSMFFGFEIRLGEAQATADFLLCFKPDPEKGRAMLSGQAEGFSDDLFQNAQWRRVRALAQEWADVSSDLYRRIENIWLEFDIADAPSPEPVPSVFFGCQDCVRSGAPESDIRWMTSHALRILHGSPLSPEVSRRVEEAVRALPSGAFVFQIGAMLARPSRAVRMCIRDISGRKIPEYLEAIGWSGSSETLTSLFAEIAPLADRIDLDIDIDEDGVQPKIGLEWYLYNHLRVDSRWDVFLRWLVARGLSTPEKSRALYDYPGAQTERSKGVVWPQYLQELSAARGPKYVSTILRAVHHIKVNYHPERGMEAKAYLAVCHNLLNTQPFISGQHPVPQQQQLAPVPEFSVGSVAGAR